MNPQKPANKNKKTGRVNRKSREELNAEARDRKRQKRHRGNEAGSRTSTSSQSGGGKSSQTVKDPRIGSKKPIDLLASSATTQKPTEKIKIKQGKPSALSPEEELALLENDERLDALLERLEAGDVLSADDKTWVDNTLDRIDVLMETLGIAYDDEDDEEEEKTDDLMRLLKGN